MACTSCSSSFGLLRKEVGCDMCGFSFCSKCCCKKWQVEGTDKPKKQLICNKCYDKVSSDEKLAPATYSPPMAYKKRMEKIGNRSMSLDGGSASSWTNEKDKEIAERLQKLKRERNKEARPSQGELEERLAKLKGMDPAKYTAPPIMVYRPADKRTSIEQSEDLMKQIVEEAHLDAKQPKPEDEIAVRLAKLKGELPPVQPVSETVVQSTVYVGVESAVQREEEVDVDEASRFLVEQYRALAKQADSEIKDLRKMKEYKEALKKRNKEHEKDSDEDIDEDEEADKIVQQLMAAKIDSAEMDDPESMNGANCHSLDDAEDKNESDEEFPWCVICTEDAKIRCFGCDSELYCTNCFRDCHDSLDIKDHKSCPFLSPKKM